jgi:hypothetical protein
MYILSDKGINEHTKLLINDMKKIRNSDKFNIILSKPLTKSICIMCDLQITSGILCFF